MENREVAKILQETAQLLEIDGAIIGRYRSYEKVAELLYSIHERIEDLAKDDAKLKELPGVGDGMAAHIREILETGDYSLRQKLLKKYPLTLLDLLHLQGMGPKKVAILFKKFKVATVEGVEKLASEGKLRDLEGFGEKTETNILKATAMHKRSSGRFKLDVADETAQKLVAYIGKVKEIVESVTPAGSLRRGKETIGDLDLLVTLRPGHDKQKHVDEVAAHILKFPGIDQTLAHGENKVSVLLGNGLQVDVRLLEKDSFGAALMYFTGSKEHNVVLRGRARDLGWTLNEYALTTLKGGKFVAGKTEEEIYKKLGLDYIEPELRENTGEIAAAENHTLPNLREARGHSRRPADAYHGFGRPQFHRRNGRSGEETWIRIHRAHRSLQGRNRSEWHGRKAHARANKENPRGPGTRAGDSFARGDRSGHSEDRQARSGRRSARAAGRSRGVGAFLHEPGPR